MLELSQIWTLCKRMPKKRIYQTTTNIKKQKEKRKISYNNPSKRYNYRSTKFLIDDMAKDIKRLTEEISELKYILLEP